MDSFDTSGVIESGPTKTAAPQDDFDRLGVKETEPTLGGTGEDAFDRSGVVESGGPKEESSPSTSTESFGSQVLQGAQRSVAPMTMSAEDLKKHSAGELVGQVGTDVGSALAAGAIGGAIGTAVAGPAGTVAGSLLAAGVWGTYKGISQELASAKEQGREPSLANMALGIGAEIAPLQGGGKLIVGAKEAIFQSALTYRQSDGDVKAATLAGLVGGGLAGLAAHEQGFAASILAPRVAHNIPTSPQEIAGVMELAKDSSYQLGKRTAEAAEKVGADYFAMPGKVVTAIRANAVPVDEETVEFMHYLSGNPTVKLVRNADDALIDISGDTVTKVAEQYKNISEAVIAKSYTNFKWDKLSWQVLNDDADLSAAVLSGVKDPLNIKSVNTMTMPAFYMGQEADRITGDNLTAVMRMAPEAQNQFTAAASPFIKQAQKVIDQGKALGLDRQEIGLRMAGRSTSEAWETAAGQALESDAGALVRNVKAFAVDKGYGIQDIENYFPEITKNPAEFAKALKDEWSRITEGQLNQVVTLNDETQPFMKALATLKGDANDLPASLRPGEITKLVKSVLEPGTIRRFMASDSASLFEQSTSIPDFVRDFDFGRSMTSYINRTLKPVFFTDFQQQLNSKVALLRGFGMSNSAVAVEDFGRAMAGQSSDVMVNASAWMQRLKLAGLEQTDAARAAIAGGSKIGGYAGLASAKVKQFAGDFVSWATSNFYQSVLGGNPANVLRAGIQPFLTTAQELGGANGYNTVMRGYLRAAQEAGKLTEGVTTEGAKKYLPGALRMDLIQDFTRSKGLLNTMQNDTLNQNAITAGLQGIPILGKVFQGGAKVGQALMIPHSIAETSNHYVGYWIGQVLGEDLMKGAPTAVAFVQKASPNLQAGIYKALKAGDTAAMKNELSSYIVAKTMFHYGAPATSKIGRDYGRLASMFTMWPSMVARDYIDVVRNKDVQGALSRFAPLAALMGANYMIHDMNESTNPAKKLLLGRSLVELHPIGALANLVNPPPLIKTAMDMAGTLKKLLEVGNGSSSFVQDDLVNLGDSTFKTLAPYMPFGYLDVMRRRLERANDVTKE